MSRIFVFSSLILPLKNSGLRAGQELVILWRSDVANWDKLALFTGKIRLRWVLCLWKERISFCHDDWDGFLFHLFFLLVCGVCQSFLNITSIAIGGGFSAQNVIHCHFSIEIVSYLYHICITFPRFVSHFKVAKGVEKSPKETSGAVGLTAP